MTVSEDSSLSRCREAATNVPGVAATFHATFQKKNPTERTADREKKLQSYGVLTQVSQTTPRLYRTIAMPPAVVRIDRRLAWFVHEALGTLRGRRH